MREQLSSLAGEYEDLQMKLQDPSVYGNVAELTRIGKRIAELRPIVEAKAQLERAQRTIQSVEEVKEDPELLAIAEGEAAMARAAIPALEAKIQELLTPKDPLDERNAILEVRAGTGGEEAALFAAELLRMYLRYSETQGWKTQLLDKADADAGGIKEAIVRVEGDGVYGHLKYEGGVHRVQRIPSTEAKGRVHTSAATVAVLPEAEQVDVPIRNEDLRVDTYRSGGAGGQHVNKTESAVRITHIPTGVVVACQSERSQIQNRERALEFLRTKLYAHEQERQRKDRGDLRSSQVKSGDRSDKIRTYNFPQDRLTDHRLGENFHNLPGIMEGEIDPIVSSLKAAEQEERMKSV